MIKRNSDKKYHLFFKYRVGTSDILRLITPISMFDDVLFVFDRHNRNIKSKFSKITRMDGKSYSYAERLME